MKKFIGTLIKATFFSWLAMFLLIEPVSVVLLAALSGMGVIDLNQTIGSVTVYGMTALLFCGIWIHAYAGNLASVRMKWELRGVGQD